MKDAAAKSSPKPAVLSLAQLLERAAGRPAALAGSSRDCCRRRASCLWAASPRWARSLLVANLALALAAGKDRAGFPIPAARRVLVCQFELPIAAVCRPPGDDAPHPWEPPPTKTCWWTRAPAAICSARRRG